MPRRHLALLSLLVTRAPLLVTKDDLMHAGWPGIVVGDNTLTQAISQIRTTLDAKALERYVATMWGRGYRFVAPVEEMQPAVVEVDIDAFLEPNRLWLEGRHALETLTRPQIDRARDILDDLVRRHGDDASYQVGLANACAFQFESTRADLEPDVAALQIALTHARRACQLDPRSGEAWAVLGFVLERTGDASGALAALRRATSLDPDNWRLLLRLAAASWGSDRLHAVRDTLHRCPGLPLAHLLSAMVWVARDDISQAQRELDAGIASLDAERSASVSYSAVALHYARGLIHASLGDLAAAHACFDAELALEARGHLYSKECCTNTWYAKGACHLRDGNLAASAAAFDEALARMPHHPLARAGRAALARRGSDPVPGDLFATSRFIHESVLARAALRVDAGDTVGAVQMLIELLRAAPVGSAGWLIPIEPLLQVTEARDTWAPVLALLQVRAR